MTTTTPTNGARSPQQLCTDEHLEHIRQLIRERHQVDEAKARRKRSKPEGAHASR